MARRAWLPVLMLVSAFGCASSGGEKPAPAKPEPAKPEPAKPEPAKPSPPATPAPAKPAPPATPEPTKPAPPATPEPTKPAPAPAVSDASPAPEGPGAFVGAATCKKCHVKQWRTWNESKMAKSFAILLPDAAKEAKLKAKLDPAKDYTKVDACVRCHVTGFDRQGGYPKGNPDAPLALDRLGVQCESCHGAGSLYSPYMKEHEKDFDPAQAKKLGLVMPDANLCLACHKGGADGSPTLDPAAPFDAAAKLKSGEGVHVHVKKK